jgi:hypothetical protein
VLAGEVGESAHYIGGYQRVLELGEDGKEWTVTKISDVGECRCLFPS